MDKNKRAELVQQYKDGVGEVQRALEGATDAELDVRPAPDKWTAREIVHHLADSEMTSAIRLRRLIAEDRPVIVAYDQEEYARRLHYNRPIAASMRAFAAARETTAELLDGLSDAEWAREGTHSESGHYTVLIWLEIYAKHAHGHADQIRRARQAATVRT
jgi:hypothetical protein